MICSLFISDDKRKQRVEWCGEVKSVQENNEFLCHIVGESAICFHDIPESVS